MNRRIVIRRGAFVLLASLTLLAAPVSPGGAQQRSAKPQDPRRPADKVLKGKPLDMDEHLGKLREGLLIQEQELQGKLLEGQFALEGQLVHEQLLQEKLLNAQLLDMQVLDMQVQALDAQLVEEHLVKGQLAGEVLMDKLGAMEMAHGQHGEKLLSLDARLSPGKPSWYPADPADSAYRAAYQLFSRQEYRAAAERFGELRTKYPTTRYLCDASYFEAFARYRLGTPAELRTARKVLDGMDAGCATA